MVFTFLAFATTMAAAMTDPGYSNFWDASTLSRPLYGPAGASDHPPGLRVRFSPAVSAAQALKDKQDDDGRQQVLTAEDLVEQSKQSSSESSSPSGWIEYMFQYVRKAGSQVWRLFTDPHFSFPDAASPYVQLGRDTLSTFNNMSSGFFSGQMFGLGGGTDTDADVMNEDKAGIRGRGFPPNRLIKERSPPPYSASSPSRPPGPSNRLPLSNQSLQYSVGVILLSAFVAGALVAARRNHKLSLRSIPRAGSTPPNLLV